MIIKQQFYYNDALFKLLELHHNCNTIHLIYFDPKNVFHLRVNLNCRCSGMDSD